MNTLNDIAIIATEELRAATNCEHEFIANGWGDDEL